MISTVYTVRFDVNNPDNNLHQQMSHILPPIGGVNVDGILQAISQHHKRNLNDWNFAEHFEPDVFVQVCYDLLMSSLYSTMQTSDVLIFFCLGN